MPWQKKSKPKAERVVRHKLSDGTIKEYRYKSYAPKPIIRSKDTLSSLIDAFRDSPEWRGLAQVTQVNYAIYLRPLEKVGHVAPIDVKRRDILLLRDVIARERGNGAAKGFIRSCSVLFRWAVDREWIEHSPVTKIRPLEGGHLRAWTPEDARIALDGLPEHMRRVVVLALYTGQRRADLCTMGWSAYDGSTIRLVQHKTGAPLVIPTHPTLKAELDAWKPTATATTILTNADGRPWKPALLSYHMPTMLAKLGLPDDLNVHGLRKLAAANLAEAGCSTKEIGAVTGHATLSMIDLYTRSADQERLAGAAILRLSNIQKPTNDKEKSAKGRKS